MNELLKELAEQCRKKFTCHECGESPFDHEKFAELLVKECIKQAHNVANLRGVNDQMIYGADSAAVLISKLFKD